MRNTFLLLLCFCMGRVGAQNSFERIYESTTSYQMDLHELNSGNILAAYAYYPGISLLDPDGNFMQSKCFYGDSVLTMGSIRKYSDNEFYFVATYRKDSCSSAGAITIPFQRPAIGRMDSLGNIEVFRYYSLNAECCNSPGGLEILQDKNLVVWGRNDRLFALRVDSMGVPRWARRFEREGTFRFIKELPGGDLLAGFDLDTVGAVVARFDPDGNFIWCKSYMRPLGRIHDAVIGSDSSFIVTGYTGNTPYKLFMMKLNGDGEVQWCRGYDNTPNGWGNLYASQIRPTIDGNYVFLATLGASSFPYFSRPFLMKTDTNGDTLWTRSVGVTGFVYDTRDLLVCSDGGFMFSGSLLGDLPNNNSGLPYILKADAEGHFPCNERQQSVQIVDLFPTDSSIVLNSIDGATVHPAFVNDTVFAPLSVYDACMYTPVRVSSREHLSRPSVRPNPTTGLITVEFNAPHLAESYYSLFDTMGKLLLQRPLPTGATVEEVDLTRFGAGSYVIRFTSPDGVCYERVVVE